MKLKKTLSALAIILVTTGLGAKAKEGFNIEQYKDDIINLLPVAEDDDNEIAANAYLRSLGDKLSSGYESAKKSFGGLADDAQGKVSDWADKAGDFAESVFNNNQMKQMNTFLADKLKHSE